MCGEGVWCAVDEFLVPGSVAGGAAEVWVSGGAEMDVLGEFAFVEVRVAFWSYFGGWKLRMGGVRDVYGG